SEPNVVIRPQGYALWNSVTRCRRDGESRHRSDYIDAFNFILSFDEPKVSVRAGGNHIRRFSSKREFSESVYALRGAVTLLECAASAGILGIGDLGADAASARAALACAAALLNATLAVHAEPCKAARSFRRSTCIAQALLAGAASVTCARTMVVVTRND